MPWLRGGDNAATYPALMQLQGRRDADERTVNEVFGFLMRCAFQSAAHMTDYILDAGTAHMIGGARTTDLIKLCTAAKVLTPFRSEGLQFWTLIADPEFIHMRLRAEIEWERIQRNDTKKTALTVPVRRRDGDNCRWCGLLVMWRGQRSSRTGTLDHLNPGVPGTVETMVVACVGCNSARAGNVDLWADNHIIRPVPPAPKYGKWTAKLLTDNGYPTNPNVHSDEAPPLPAGATTATPSEPAPALAAALVATSPQVADPLRPETWQPPRESGARVEPESHHQVVQTAHAGSGRVGSTPVGTSPGAQPPPPKARRRRGKRGGSAARLNKETPLAPPP